MGAIARFIKNTSAFFAAWMQSGTMAYWLSCLTANFVVASSKLPRSFFWNSDISGKVEEEGKGKPRDSKLVAARVRKHPRAVKEW